jgi:uncharacterized protein YjbJ (UPF0337 family)
LISGTGRRRQAGVGEIEEGHMGTGDRVENSAEETKGKLKQGLGEVTDNDRLKTEGKVDETKGNLKNAGEDIKDAAKRVFGGDKT